MYCYYKVETEQQTIARLRTAQGLHVNANAPKTGADELRRIRKEERENLFVCFRKFFLDYEKTLFSLQNIDEMLVHETKSCEERLINKKCMKKHRTKDSGSVTLTFNPNLNLNPNLNPNPATLRMQEMVEEMVQAVAVGVVTQERWMGQTMNQVVVVAVMDMTGRVRDAATKSTKRK